MAYQLHGIVSHLKPVPLRPSAAYFVKCTSLGLCNYLLDRGCPSMNLKMNVKSGSPYLPAGLGKSGAPAGYGGTCGLCLTYLLIRRHARILVQTFCMLGNGPSSLFLCLSGG